MPNGLVKIGQLAKVVGVLPSTINYYTNEGLIKESQRSQGGYRLYEKKKTLKVIEFIQKLQKEKRLTIEEIKQAINKNKSLN